jgi:hypothetical protein
MHPPPLEAARGLFSDGGFALASRFVRERVAFPTVASPYPSRGEYAHTSYRRAYVGAYNLLGVEYHPLAT